MRFSTEEILQPFHTTWLPADIQAATLRLDRIHPVVSGNKWFKLKYNLEAAAGRPVVTFGGAYSNHIIATAAACEMRGIPCTGIIRGEKPAVLSHTLQRAASLGMELVFVSREAYRLKDASAFPDAYMIPEGGHNALGAKGCGEILSLADTMGFSHIICAVGTGTMLAGLVNATERPVTGISVLKNATSLYEETQALLTSPETSNWTILHQFHEGGYGKTSPRLFAAMNDFYRQTGIPTDQVYTGKMVSAVQQLLEQSYFPPNSRLLLIHSGGLQGNDSLPPGVLCF
ncbi:1-aminocyclopropane-1-carboxylate deaminase/D-cysteine desulfhydrase [Chitinophaga cymbidii]|uniref:1-aminocyclopropane-1-carboxylate deaminase n=1 Tax=Chitinophaga cymbidii TaxID=1096750 RepID=A0A512RLC6_9BACT|nr:pyridoxal-phosphate dependent enzyme [Chitinophaga cymbidii]GEP96479.1 1-aminocyclopropane-1-carboxylate deaminase [Chitinophaga cymbidii]